MDTYDFRNLYGKEIKDIGRLLSTDEYEMSYDFNDYSGACYLEIGKKSVILEPDASIDGEEITVSDQQDFDAGDRGKYSFKKFYKGIIDKALKGVTLDEDQITFHLDEGQFSLELKDKDRIGIDLA